MITDNIKIVKNVLVGNYVIVLDLSFSLPTEDFVWETEGPINEHLSDKGRLFVAQELAKVF